MYRELVQDKISNRGHIVPAGEIKPVAHHNLRYCSHYMFGADILAHVAIHKNPETGKPTVAGFKGKVYCEAIWIDVDCRENVNEARLSTIEIIKRLNLEYQINPDHLFLYFSGNKGFHLAIHNTFVGFNHTTPIEPDKVKDFVRRLTKGINHVDDVIYDPVRILRVENSRHEKSGLYKVRISYNELQCEMPDIALLAKQPRNFPYKYPTAGFEVNKGLNNLWLNSGAYIQEVRESEGKTNFFAAPKDGNRNVMLLKQACMLFRKSELSNNAVLDIIRNAAELSNMGASHLLDEGEIKTIVRNAEKLVGDDRKIAKQEELVVKSFGEWIPEWENYILQEQTNMSLVFQDVNTLMKGRLKGKLGVIMGYGGSKKSLYALNVCLRNMKLNDEISIYSTMEMSVPQLINRIISHEVYVDGANANAADFLADTYRKDVNEGRRFLVDQLAKEMGNKLQITPNGRMTYETYKEAIRKVKETTGNPGILVVDGLSMMGGKGTETEIYSKNSADLKQLANEENMLVLLICHVSKGEEKFTRDLSRNIRGSEKILDNCDWYATMSQIQDEANPEMYRQDLGFVNFNDKRGSGQTVELIYHFETNRLKLNDTNVPPEQYREPVKKKFQKAEDF